MALHKRLPGLLPVIAVMIGSSIGCMGTTSGPAKLLPYPQETGRYWETAEDRSVAHYSERRSGSAIQGAEPSHEPEGLAAEARGAWWFPGRCPERRS